ncbi:hypothetical protein Q5P01_012236 [Channa striata]|uniref:Uncharacterized protein n=1 Tax=Channa striata TaxID=64152 RepID=A0AA88MNC1_CHASR|nr:hypothetical protein Q5P01_012236 [Channa striata]
MTINPVQAQFIDYRIVTNSVCVFSPDNSQAPWISQRLLQWQSFSTDLSCFTSPSLPPPFPPPHPFHICDPGLPLSPS